MFGCYRKGDANDPAVYTAAIAATLAEFPAEVIEWVTDPRTGIPARSKWLPSVAEVREACETRNGFVRSRDRLLNAGWIQAQDGRWIKPNG